MNRILALLIALLAASAMVLAQPPIVVTPPTSSTSVFTAGDGTKAAPSYAFTSATDTGLFLGAGGIPTFSMDGITAGQTYADANDSEIYACRTDCATVSSLYIQAASAGVYISTGLFLFGIPTHDWGIDGTNFNLYPHGTTNTQDLGGVSNLIRTGYFGTSVISPVVNATTGVQINGVATTGTILRGNGTNYIGTTATYPTTSSAGQYLISTTTNAVIAVAPALVQANPADQTGNATATFKMNGLGAAASPCVITPVATGRIIFEITGDVANTVTANNTQWKLAFGTGTPPANGAAASGTVIGATRSWTSLTGMLQVPFSIVGSSTGNALNTAVWFDLQLADITATATSTVKSISCSAHEM
jgi:hypothetical protein